jgi:hypothetical protein
VVVRLAVALAVTVGCGFIVYDVVVSRAAKVSGPYAEFTRSELAALTTRGSSRNPALLPRDLPPGAGRSDDSGFYLLNKPITADGRRHAGEVWLSVYSVSALPAAVGNVTGYSVYQEWMGSPERHRRRCMGKGSFNEGVVRRVGDDKLTICLGPHPTDVARNYWKPSTSRRI